MPRTLRFRAKAIVAKQNNTEKFFSFSTERKEQFMQQCSAAALAKTTDYPTVQNWAFAATPTLGQLI
jgi:hypothetical protein